MTTYTLKRKMFGAFGSALTGMGNTVGNAVKGVGTTISLNKGKIALGAAGLAGAKVANDAIDAGDKTLSGKVDRI